MEKQCMIFSGGEFSGSVEREEGSFVIACDHGLAYALSCGITPDLLVGDFDSYTLPLPPGIPVLDLPVEKDDTDTMAAVRYAVKEKYSHIKMLHAFGGRLDHLLGNLQAAAFAAEHGVETELYGADERVVFLASGERVFLPQPGWSLSVLAFSDRCEGVSIQGAKYELKDARVSNTFPIGVSNEWNGPVTVRVKQGILMVISSRMSEKELEKR